MLETTRLGLFSAGILCIALAASCGGEESGGGSGGGGVGGASATSGPGATSGNGPSTGAGAGTGTGSATTGNGVGPGPTSGPSTVTSSGAGGDGGAPPECGDVDPNSIYALSAVDFLSFETVNLCELQGEVLMIANIASQCGYTYQMADLQYLQDTFGGEGFHLLGFLSNDFGSQAGTQEQIEACNAEHHITFQEFEIGPVTASPQPVFAWLQSQPNPGPDDSLVPSWNFNKYIISRTGQLVGKYDEHEAWGTDSSLPAFNDSPAVQKVREALAED